MDGGGGGRSDGLHSFEGDGEVSPDGGGGGSTYPQGEALADGGGGGVESRGNSGDAEATVSHPTDVGDTEHARKGAWSGGLCDGDNAGGAAIEAP
jgi:hypothetical protein